MRNFLSFALILITSYSAAGQEVVITNIKRVANNVEVEYNIVDDNKDHSYSLQLYASSDNFTQPLTNVTGDFGVDIKVGDNKKIVWNAKEALGTDFAGNVRLELKGRMYVPFIAIEGLQEGTIFKRDKPNLTWSGGRGDNVLSFEFYRGVSRAYEETDDRQYLVRKLSLKTRKYLTSGNKEYVSDGIRGQHSPFAQNMLEALRSNGWEDKILILDEIKLYMERLLTTPRFGEFGDDQTGSDFVFVAK